MPAPALSLGELLSGLEGPRLDRASRDIAVNGVEELLVAGVGHLSLASAPCHEPDLRRTRAGAVLVVPALATAVPSGSLALVSEDAERLLMLVLDRLYPAASSREGQGEHALQERGAVVADSAVIGAGVEIGSGAVVGAHAVIGRGVAIGRNARVGAGCTIECAYLGDGVSVGPGARIGSEGVDAAARRQPRRQLGRVIVQDRVSIGANAVIERGLFGDTVVGEGSRVGALAVVGPNSRIGRLCAIARAVSIPPDTFLPDGMEVGGDVIPLGYRPLPGTR